MEKAFKNAENKEVLVSKKRRHTSYVAKIDKQPNMTESVRIVNSESPSSLQNLKSKE